MSRRNLEGYLGEVFRAWPSRREILSIRPRALADAVTGRTAPELGIEAARQTAPGVWRFQFALENRGRHPTAMALVDTNFLEIQIEGGSFGRVDLGDFHRYELGRIGQESTSIEQVRNANRMRLFFPMLDPGWRVSSGDIEVVTAGKPRVRAGAVYLLPDGQRFDTPQADWQSWLPPPEDAKASEAQPVEGSAEVSTTR